MNKIAIQAKRDFLERLANAPPLKAVSELIWNGLDAGADRIIVHLETNGVEGLEKIRVRDSGSGIDHSEIDVLFGNLGDSWKKSKNRFRGRALHGKSGQARFKAFSLGSRVEWDTVYEASGHRMRYQIIGRANALTDLQYTDPVPANTTKIVTGLLLDKLLQDQLPPRLGQEHVAAKTIGANRRSSLLRQLGIELALALFASPLGLALRAALILVNYFGHDAGVIGLSPFETTRRCEAFTKTEKIVANSARFLGPRRSAPGWQVRAQSLFAATLSFRVFRLSISN
ncbi:MAG TPA: ATP-binding protein [Terrimicrobiaceae bacterium]